MATYSFMNVTATLVGAGGIIDLGHGAAVAKEGITVEPAGNKNVMTIGADGEGMHSVRADKSAKVTVRFMKTSPVNAKLQMLYNAQSLSSTAWGQNIITINQSNSGDKVICRSCAFAKAPTLTYAEEGDMVEWSFDALKVDTLLGEYE